VLFRSVPPAHTVVRGVDGLRLRRHSADSTLPPLWPTGSSSGWLPSIAARSFSSCPSDSTSRSTPCPPWPWPPEPARRYPRLRIWRPPSERQRDFNPPEHVAAQRTQWTPSDTQRCFRLNAELRAATPRSTGSPALRRALCRRATPTTPVSDPAVIGQLLLRDPAAFPVRMAGRRSQRPFRGLLGLHSYCGPSTRRPTHGGPMFRELQRFGCPPRRLGSYRDVPTISRTGLSPARDTALSAAHIRTRVSVTIASWPIDSRA
jgi:hypothetical protein